MSISKTTADRHQRILLDLVLQPGNNTCADCKRPNPRWASHNLGVFLCVTCASVHRKIGVHVTKVKSLTLDSWNKEQLDNMKNMGNIKANQLYNPDERRNPPPANLEDTDRGSDLENYIRGKYESKRFMGSRTKIDRPASTTTSNTLSVPEPPSRSKSTPIRQPSAPPPPLPATSPPTVASNSVTRPPRSSSIPATVTQTQARPSLSSPQYVPQPVTQQQRPPPPPAGPTPQTTGMSGNVLNDMMAIQSNGPSMAGPGPSFSTPIQPQHTSFMPNATSPFQRPLNTGLSTSPFGLGISPTGPGSGQTTSPTSYQPSTSPFGMSSQASFGSLSPGAGVGSMYPSSQFGMPTGNRSASLPMISPSNPFPQPQNTAISPQPTGTSLAQMAASMSPPGSMSQQPQGNSSNPFLQPSMGTGMNMTMNSAGSPLGSPPLNNMYTGNPMQMQVTPPFSPFQQPPQQQQQQQQYFGGQFAPTGTPDFNTGQFGGGGQNQTNPFGAPQQNAFGFGSGAGGWHN